MSIKNILRKLNSRDTQILPSINTSTKIIFIIVAVVTSTFFAKNIVAANNILKQTQDYQGKSNNLESWQLSSWNTTAVNALTTFTGPIPFKEDGDIDIDKYKVTGLLGTSVNAIASLYSPQSSGIQYIAQIKDNFLGKATYAQGVSFNSGNSLQQLLPMWKVLRNIIYALSAIVFIIVGIMIMLRVKISPQAVITIQSSIPNIITTLILVTFSYAIAGLIIDVSYWIQALVISLIFNGKGVGLNNSLYNEGTWQTLIPIGGDLWPFSFEKLVNADFTKLSMLANRTVPVGSMILLGAVVGEVVLGSIIGGFAGLFGSGASLGGNVTGQVVGWLVGAAGGIVFMVILFIIVAIWLIKLFFGLLKTYVSIILKIIVAPIEIGMGAIPNSKVGFSSWLIDFISKVAVFPVVLIALVFINYLVEICTAGLWVPSLLQTTLHGSGLVLGAAVGLAGLAMISKLPDLVPQAIFQLKPSAFGKAIGESFTTGVGVAKGAGTMAGDKAQSKVNTATAAGGKANPFWRFTNAVTNVTSTLGWTRKSHP